MINKDNTQFQVKVMEDFMNTFGDIGPLSFCDIDSKMKISNPSALKHLQINNPNLKSCDDLVDLTPLDLMKDSKQPIMGNVFHENYYVNLDTILTRKALVYPCYSVLNDGNVWGGIMKKNPVVNNKDEIIGIFTQQIEQEITLANLYHYFINQGHNTHDVISFLKEKAIKQIPDIQLLLDREFHLLIHMEHNYMPAKLLARKFNLQEQVIRNYLYKINKKLGVQFNDVTNYIHHHAYKSEYGLIYNIN